MVRLNHPNWLRNLHSDHLRIFVALASVSLYVSVAKGAGAAKEVAVAALYGTKPIADAYTFVFSLLTSIVFVWQQIMIMILVPLLIRNEDAADGATFRREMLGLSLAAGGCLACLSGGVLWVAIHFRWLAFPSHVATEAGAMIWPLTLLVPVGMASGYLGATMMSGERLLNSLFEGVPSLVLVAFVLLLPPTSSFPLMIGTVGGFMAQFAISAAAQPSDRRVQWPRIGTTSPLWLGFWRSFCLVAAGQVIITIATSALDQVMVVSLGSAANAVLGYANRLTALALGLGATAVARAVLPIFSGAARDDLEHQRRLAWRWSGAIFVAGIFALGVGWMGAPVGVRLLFRHGAFSEADAANVTEVLRYSIIQIPFAFSGTVLVQLAASRGRYGVFLVGAVSQLICKFAANAWLIPTMGIAGAALASSIRAAEALLFFIAVVKFQSRQ